MCVSVFACVVHEPHYLSDNDLDKCLKRTVPRSKGSINLFRDMWDDGKAMADKSLFILVCNFFESP